MKNINESGAEVPKTAKNQTVYITITILAVAVVSAFAGSQWQNFSGRVFEHGSDGWKSVERTIGTSGNDASTVVLKVPETPAGPNMSVPDPNDRTYIESTQLAISMLQDGGKYLDQATKQDLGRIAYNPWINIAIPDIQKQFAKVIKEDRKKTLKIALPGVFPNVGTPESKYEYTDSGVILILKSSYLDASYSSARNSISDTHTEESVALLDKSRAEIGSAMDAALAGKLSDGSVLVSSLGEDGKIGTKIIEFKRLMDGNFNVRVTSEGSGSAAVSEVW